MIRLEEAIIKACPDATDRPITLADVLRAILKANEERILPGFGTSFLNRTELIGDVCEHWNLAANLDGQSPNTLAFLESILCKE